MTARGSEAHLMGSVKFSSVNNMIFIHKHQRGATRWSSTKTLVLHVWDMDLLQYFTPLTCTGRTSQDPSSDICTALLSFSSLAVGQESTVSPGKATSVQARVHCKGKGTRVTRWHSARTFLSFREYLLWERSFSRKRSSSLIQSILYWNSDTEISFFQPFCLSSTVASQKATYNSRQSHRSCLWPLILKETSFRDLKWERHRFFCIPLGTC